MKPESDEMSVELQLALKRISVEVVVVFSVFRDIRISENTVDRRLIAPTRPSSHVLKIVANQSMNFQI